MLCGSSSILINIFSLHSTEFIAFINLKKNPHKQRNTYLSKYLVCLEICSQPVCPIFTVLQSNWSQIDICLERSLQETFCGNNPFDGLRTLGSYKWSKWSWIVYTENSSLKLGVVAYPDSISLFNTSNPKQITFFLGWASIFIPAYLLRVSKRLGRGRKDCMIIYLKKDNTSTVK